jgi:hypothetical protein
VLFARGTVREVDRLLRGRSLPRALTPVSLEVKCGFVLLADSVDIETLAGMAP